MDNHTELRKLLPLTPAVFHILLALADRDRHGYAIMQEVERRTGGRVKMGPGTLYGTIKRLLAEGLIVESKAPPTSQEADSRRRYYRLTRRGREAAVLEAERLDQLVEMARAKQVLPETGSGG